MAEENMQNRVEEIQEKISEELRDVERLEKEERELINEEHNGDHDRHQPREVNIIIDRKHVKSPRETTGAALYLLGEVPAGFNLYRETRGPREDEFIPNDGHRVEVHEDEKFYSSPGKVTPGARNE